MGKAIKNSKKSPKLPIGLQSKLTSIKKQILQVIKNGRPYLAPKYWIIYAAAFGLGFYLWGPANGLVKLKVWRPFQTDQADRIATIQTLQREIEQLKNEIKLQKIQGLEKAIDFNPDSFSRPAFGEIIHGYDWINVNNTWKLHNGIDIETAPGSNIMASAEGVVRDISGSSEGSLTVILAHGSGWESIYGNLEEVTVKKGDQILKGTIIGTSGSESCNSKKPGFHFGITHNRQPVDPKKIIKGL